MVYSECSKMRSHTRTNKKKRRNQKDMKFLIVAKSRGTPSMPPQQMLEIIMAEYQVGKQIVEEGTNDVGYLLAGQKGGMFIGEAESGAELNAKLTRLPLFPYLDIQIYPLMTFDEGIAQVKQGLEALKAQK